MGRLFGLVGGIRDHCAKSFGMRLSMLALLPLKTQNPPDLSLGSSDFAHFRCADEKPCFLQESWHCYTCVLFSAFQCLGRVQGNGGGDIPTSRLQLSTYPEHMNRRRPYVARLAIVRNCFSGRGWKLIKQRAAWAKIYESTRHLHRRRRRTKMTHLRSNTSDCHRAVEREARLPPTPASAPSSAFPASWQMRRSGTGSALSV